MDLGELVKMNMGLVMNFYDILEVGWYINNYINKYMLGDYGVIYDWGEKWYRFDRLIKGGR